MYKNTADNFPLSSVFYHQELSILILNGDPGTSTPDHVICMEYCPDMGGVKVQCTNCLFSLSLSILTRNESVKEHVSVLIHNTLLSIQRHQV